MKYIICILSLIISGGLHAEENYIVNKDHVLYVPKSKNIRAFIEPGTILQEIKVSRNDTYKRRIRVVTPGGIIGEIVRRGYDSYEDISTSIGYLKRPLKIDNEEFKNGDSFLIEILDDDELTYKVTYPKPYLSLKDNAYYIRNKHKVMTEHDFDYNFNYVFPNQVGNKFPLWVKASSQKAVEWGCKNSKKEVSTVEVGIGGKVKVGGSFFNFFEADVHAENNNKKTITYTKTLHDEDNEHRITYWELKKSSTSTFNILGVALEKLSSCDKTKKLKYSYVIHFPKENNINPIQINHDWVHEKGLPQGGTSPIKINSLEDYRAFKKAFKDFHFQYQYPNYDMNAAILNYIMMMTANITIEYEG